MVQVSMDGSYYAVMVSSLLQQKFAKFLETGPGDWNFVDLLCY